MNRATLIWTLVFVLGGAGLFYNAVIRPDGMAKQYVEDVQVNAKHPEAGIKTEARKPLDFKADDPTKVHQSFWRTLGVWFAAFLTLCILSFLYGDNPFYKFAEALFIGVTAATYMVISFWQQIVPNVFGALVPWAFKKWALPSIALDPDAAWYTQVNWIRVVPLVFGIMLLWRLAPKGQWIARWPLAIIIGSKAGAQMVVFIQTDIMGVAGNTVLPFVARDLSGAFDFWQSLRNVGIVLGVLSVLVYFFFSIEHKGVVGKAARTGIWVLMITFGASFALTVMGRIALLSEQLQFLFDDWLWLIDPTHQRTAAVAGTALLWPFGGFGVF